MSIMQRFITHHENRDFGGYRNHHYNNNIDCKDVPIRKLYVAPIKPNITSKIQPYFATFGEVEFVQLRSKDDYPFGFVQFKMAESAQAALGHPSHRIGNYYLKVKSADAWHQPDYGLPTNPLLVPPEEDSPLHILNALNEDCLKAVFEYLDLLGLSNAAEVCVRFNQHANEIFAKKFAVLKLDYSLKCSGKITRPKLSHILQNFGSMVRTLKVHQWALQSKFPTLDLISRHCTALKELDLYGCDIKGQLEKDCAVFDKLEKLYIECSTIGVATTDFNRIFTELKSLKFVHCDMGLGKCLEQQFAKLEEAQLYKCYNLAFGTIDSFIDKNRTITKLSIVRTYRWLNSDHLRLISENLKRLQELEFEAKIDDIDQTSIMCLAQLNELKVLKLHFNGLPVTPMLESLIENKIPIEHLKIINGDINKSTIDCITTMKAMKKLEFAEIKGTLNDENLIQIAIELPDLDELHLKEADNDITTIGLKKMLVHANKLSLLHLKSVYNISIDVDDYKAMLKTVKNRREKLKLVIRIISDGDKVKVDEKMLAENRDIFYIDEDIEEEPSEEYGSEAEYDSDDDDDWFPYFDSDDDFNGAFGYVDKHGYAHTDDGDFFYVG